MMQAPHLTMTGFDQGEAHRKPPLPVPTPDGVRRLKAHEAQATLDAVRPLSPRARGVDIEPPRVVASPRGRHHEARRRLLRGESLLARLVDSQRAHGRPIVGSALEMTAGQWDGQNTQD